MNTLLELATFVTPEEYNNLLTPRFVTQTRLDQNNMYWRVFTSDGRYYKTYNKTN